jgi:hypothetical protein
MASPVVVVSGPRRQPRAGEALLLRALHGFRSRDFERLAEHFVGAHFHVPTGITGLVDLASDERL